VNIGYPIRVSILELSAEARRQGAIWLAFDVVTLLEHAKGCANAVELPLKVAVQDHRGAVLATIRL
jgi:hypothetical protein